MLSKPLNRIYQGRVTGLEIQTTTETTSAKGKITKTSAWGSALKPTDFLPLFSDFNELFQDAINYYLVALIGMAADESTPAGRVRTQIDKGDSDSVWESFRRRGVNRPGLRASVAKHLAFPPGSNPIFEAVVAKIFEGNPASPEVRNSVLSAITALISKANDNDSAIRNSARELLPLLCIPKSKANSKSSGPLVTREFHRKSLLPFLIHREPSTPLDSSEWAQFSTLSIATPDNKAPSGKLSESKAVELLQAAIHDCFGSTSHAERLTSLINTGRWGERISAFIGSSAKRGVRTQLHAWVIFEYLEKSEVTFAKLREAFPLPKKLERPAVPTTTNDPITALRGERGFAFPAFTKIIGLDWSNNLDIAAFEEALKALNQIQSKGKERKDSRDKLICIQNYQTKPSSEWKVSDDDDAGPPPKLAGDPRIARLEELLTGDLAAAYESTEGESVEYGLRPRTIRGFDTLAKHWNAIATKPQATEAELAKKLKEKLTELQSAESETIGSVVLFDALIKPENHIIWRTPDADILLAWRKTTGIPDSAEFAENPLSALTDHRERNRKIADLNRPIRLTPAHPVYSPRQIDFKKIGPKSPHETTGDGRLRLVTDIAVRNPAGRWEKRHVRLTYAAPRLLRDGLRRQNGETSLEKVPWSQPMLSALGFSDSAPQNFEDCAVMFMPAIQDGEMTGALLNFPISLDVGPIIDRLGTASRWPKSMFGLGRDFEPAWLNWPSSLDTAKHATAWWTQKKPFRILAEDLGTRDAGAFAIFEITPIKSGESPPKNGRFLGKTGDTAWYARRTATGLHRLPGEDAEVIRDGRRVEEFSGEKGRSATREESEAARSFVESLGTSDEQVEGLLGENLADTRRLSFPEQNDALLSALRRAQGRLARYQSWSALEHPDTKPERRERILDEIAETDLLDDELKSRFAASDKTPALTTLKTRAEILRGILKDKLVVLAERILPQHKFRWAWEAHPGNPKSHILHLVERTDRTLHSPRIYGQRGLSCERLEQLEELRHRAQSLNRAITHTLGKPAKFGRATREDELPDPCPDILRKLEAMKENRVKQTAHLIIADALGLRLKAHTSESRTERESRDIHGEYEKIPGRVPVDFIVLEDLNRYLADQGRSRSENSRLMQWSHREIVTRIRQLAEPFGIPVLTTPAAYTSKFCSRTGAPGFRAVALHSDHRYEFPWRKDLAKLAAHEDESAKVSDREELDRLRFVSELFTRLDELNCDELARRNAAKKTGEAFRPRWKTLVAPMGGGPFFIAVTTGGQPAAPVQADINAATNIGLRAIAAPENAEIHVRIRAQRTGSKASAKPSRGSKKKPEIEAVHGETERPVGFVVRQGNKLELSRWKGVSETDIRFTDTTAKPPAETFVNFFHDSAELARFEKAVVGKLPLATGKALWSAVKKEAWPTCEKLNFPESEPEDVRYD